MKKFLLTALLMAFALTGVVTTGSDDTTTDTGNMTPTTEETTEEGTTVEGEDEDYGVMPTDAYCEPWDCWGP